MAAKGKPPPRRKRVSNNPAKVPVDQSLKLIRRVKLPTAEELLKATASPPLAMGRRAPGVQYNDELPTAEQLLGMTEGPGAFGEDEGESTAKVDRTEYLSPTPSLDPDRPRARLASYNPDTRTLHVVFRNGGVYDYYGVPHQTWRALKSNRSFGQTLDRLVINQYQFEKVSY